jgi:hypothetical protein
LAGGPAAQERPGSAVATAKAKSNAIKELRADK